MTTLSQRTTLLADFIEQHREEIQTKAENLPLPGLVGWFLHNYLDDLPEDCETMDVIGPLAAFYS